MPGDRIARTGAAGGSSGQAPLRAVVGVATAGPALGHPAVGGSSLVVPAVPPSVIAPLPTEPQPSMSAAPPRRRKTVDVLLGALLFAALGPAIGALVLIVLVVVFATDHARPLADTIAKTGLLYAISLLFAYPLAVVPAALTGGCAGHLRRRLRSPMAWYVVGIIGAALSLGWMALLLNKVKFESDAPVLAASGFLAGAVCAWLLGRWFGPDEDGPDEDSQPPSPRPEP